MKLKIFIPLTGLTLFLTGCGHDATTPTKAPELPTVSVTVGQATVGVHRFVEEIVGSIQPRTRSLVAAKVSGRIKQLETTIGKAVAEGVVLAEIDAAEIKARLDQARATLKNAEQELARFKTMLAQSAVTQSEFDAVESRHRIATAGVTEAETMLGYTLVRAPFDGVLSRQLANIGDLASPGKPLLELESKGGLRFESDIPESLISSVHLGEQLMVKIDGLAAPVPGTIAEIAPAANPLSRTLPVKLDLPETAGIRAGQFGRLQLPTTAGRNTRVPSGAVLQRGQLELVFVVEAGHANMRIVKTGKRFDDQVEILAGIESGESVIISANTNLRDGQPIVSQ